MHLSTSCSLPSWLQEHLLHMATLGIPLQVLQLMSGSSTLATSPSITAPYSLLWSPCFLGTTRWVNTAFSFLVEHKQKHFMFDLGMRNDSNFVPALEAAFAAGLFQFDAPKDITGLLEGGGIPLSSIEAVIWSHAHFDHIGDMSKFPNTTGLIIGAETNTSTFPEFPAATLRASDFAGHNITKIDFSTAKLTFGGMKAVDFFGDGSFYLLNAPGHLGGHMAALARVTPTSFVILAGDTFHHAGVARPSPQFQKNFPCPAHLLEEAKSAISTDFFWSSGSRVGAFDVPSRTHAFFTISDLPTSGYIDPPTADVSLEKLTGFDADADFFLIASHDLSLKNSLPYFPAYLNDWQKSQLKRNTVWNFVDPANPAFRLSPTNQTA
ncbi:beta-lactamase-like protein [Mycena alexandri]|uniref:Beta-lactamase-like protein n=1 Tax=Mycena alexandri TaxID=1745969 RepID=A0AAD6RZE9_9AGAR|nr:beta-lactamase-like protein [Mycena alexandri]